MSVMNVLRRAAAPAAAGLAAAGLLAAGAPAQAAPAALHVTATIGLGSVGSRFTYEFSEAPNGTVYYFKGRVVYAVAGSKKPVAAPHAAGNVLGVAANSTDLFVEVGRTVTAYKRSGGHRVRSWTLPRSPGPLTSAGLFAVGSTVWAWTDWATDESGFEFADVSRIRTSVPAVHKVSANIAYPADMAANSAGLYYEATTGAKGYLIHVSPSGRVTKHADRNIDAPLTLADGRVYLLAIHEKSGREFLDSFSGASLHADFTRAVSSSNYGIAATGAGLLMLGPGNVSRLSPGTGATTGSLTLAHVVTLVPGSSGAVITVSHGRADLVRLAS